MTEEEHSRATVVLNSIEATKHNIIDICTILKNLDKGSLTYPQSSRWTGLDDSKPLYAMNFLYYDKFYDEMNYRKFPISKESVRFMLSTTLKAEKEKLERLEEELKVL